MIFTDLGSYVTPKGISILPWPVLLEAGVEGVIFKGDQEDLSRGVSTTRSIQQAWDGGAKTVGCFYWDDPTVLVQVLLDSYSRAIDREKPEFFSVDIEQYKDWSGNILSPSFLNDHAQGLTEGLAARFPEIFMMPYSAKYMLTYIPGLAGWIDNFENWTAAWPDAPGPRYRMSLAEIRRGDVHRTLYKAEDGSYPYDVINIRENWQASTNQKICLLCQYSSRIMPPLDRVGGTIYDHQYDWNYTPLTIEEWRQKINHTGGSAMAGIENKAIALADRSRWLRMNSDIYKSVDATIWDQIDGAMIRIGGQDKINEQKQRIFYADSAFPIWQGAAKQRGKRVILTYAISAEWFKWQNIDLSVVQGWDKWTDRVLAHLLSLWHIQPMVDLRATLEAEKADPSKWYTVDAVEIQHVEGQYENKEGVGAPWLAAIFNSLADHLKQLMDEGLVPKRPILMYTYPALMNLIPETIVNRREWLKLSLANWVYNPGNAIDNRPFTEFWAARLPADWSWKFGFPVWYGGEVEYSTSSLVWFWEWTNYLFRLPELHTRDEAGNPVNGQVAAVAFCDTPESLPDYLGVPSAPPPDEPPPPTLEARVSILERQMERIYLAIRNFGEAI